jgi:hypothetical protein
MSYNVKAYIASSKSLLFMWRLKLYAAVHAFQVTSRSATLDGLGNPSEMLKHASIFACVCIIPA